MSVEGIEPAVMFSFPEAARLMGIGKSALYDLVRAGQLRVVKIGKRGRRVPRAEIDRYIRMQLEDV